MVPGPTCSKEFSGGVWSPDPHVAEGSHLQNEISDFSPRPICSKESVLRYQLRSLACFPDGLGYVHGSVEGRASWE